MYFEHPQISMINIEIPNDIKDNLEILTQQDCLKLGICYDIQSENYMYPYNNDGITMDNWINSGTNELEKSTKITSIYKYLLTN